MCYTCREEGQNSITEEDEINFVLAIKSKDPYKIRLPINKRNIEFEIDTGSGKTIISENVYRQNLNEFPLERTDIVLKTYSGENLKVRKLFVEIEHEQKSVEEFVYVIQGNGPTLLGRDVLSKHKDKLDYGIQDRRRGKRLTRIV